MMENLTIKSAREKLDKKELSARELFTHYIRKIGHHKDLNAFISTFDFQDNQTAGSLTGIPCAIKDNILIDGTVTTAGSRILNNYTAAYNATVIKKLKNAGAEFIGKTNMDEFAMGSSTENSAFGTVKNPHDPERVPGGSSGGSAAAVAADLAVFALGSDTGGSIRQPASLCGVVGLKPTYGRVSRHGLIAMASSLDQIGPFTKNVYDSALVLNILASNDIFDSTTVSLPQEDFTNNLNKEIKGIRIGVPKEFFGAGLAPEVNEKVQSAISTLERLGCNIVEISLPHSEYALAVYYIIMPCEVSANLSRFDGIRYGHSTKEAKDLAEVYFKSRAEGFGPEPKRRIMLGAYALSSGYYDAYYLKAQKVRALIKQDYEKAFDPSANGVDVIVGPTSPSVAFKIGEKSNDPLAMYLSDIYTVPANLAGLPAISIPCGLINNLPVGFQIIANQYEESKLLNTAYKLEQELNP